MDTLSLKALAKINLGLDVIRRREDGYHEVSMIMQTINMYDRLELKKIKEPEIIIHTNLKFLPVDSSNLVYKAAAMLRDEFQIKEGIEVDLQKRIPVAAGMAGGSSDCSAMLFGMNRMFDLGLSMDELMQRGAKLGADVPYCLMRGTALAEGIGEILTPLPPMVKCPVLIAKPKISVSTKWVYQNLKLDENTVHPDIKKQIEAIERKDLKGVCDAMGNVLADVTMPSYPVISQIRDKMLESGAVGSMMSGSGPTVFGLFEDMNTAKQAKEVLRQSGLARTLYVTSLYNNRETKS